MDPISHAAFGAGWAQSRADAGKISASAWCAVIGAVAPDLDTVLRLVADPLLALEYHRQFTHALAFVPIGALLCAALAWRFARKRLTFAATYFACFLGYLSHPLLDACTTYGTQLFWPFSDARIAWNIIAVFDPLFLVPVVGLAVLAAVKRQRRFARVSIVWAGLYLTLATVQHYRAERTATALAASRQQAPARLTVTPAFSSLLLWKTIYEHDGRYYVDAVRTTFRTTTYDGMSIGKLDVGRDFPWLAAGSLQAVDVERFRAVADDWLAVDPTAANRIVDLRYSLVPNEIAGFWALELDRAAPALQHASLVSTQEEAPAQALRLLDMLM